MAFLVTNIIDENTFQVTPWKLGEQGRGTKVRIWGTTNPNDPNYKLIAINRLRTLIENKEVDLKAPSRLEKDSSSNELILVCRVVLNNVDIINYFPEMAQQKQA